MKIVHIATFLTSPTAAKGLLTVTAVGFSPFLSI